VVCPPPPPHHHHQRTPRHHAPAPGALPALSNTAPACLPIRHSAPGACPSLTSHPAPGRSTIGGCTASGPPLVASTVEGIPVDLPVPRVAGPPTATGAALAWDAVARPNGAVLGFALVLFRLDGCPAEAEEAALAAAAAGETEAPQCSLVSCAEGLEACGLVCIDPQISVCCNGVIHPRVAGGACCGDSYSDLAAADAMCCGGRAVPRLAGFACCGGAYVDPVAEGLGPGPHVCCAGVLRRGDMCCGSQAYTAGPANAGAVCCGSSLFDAFENRICCGGALSSVGFYQSTRMLVRPAGGPWAARAYAPPFISPRWPPSPP